MGDVDPVDAVDKGDKRVRFGLACLLALQGAAEEAVVDHPGEGVAQGLSDVELGLVAEVMAGLGDVDAHMFAQEPEAAFTRFSRGQDVIDGHEAAFGFGAEEFLGISGVA